MEGGKLTMRISFLLRLVRVLTLALSLQLVSPPAWSQEGGPAAETGKKPKKLKKPKPKPEGEAPAADKKKKKKKPTEASGETKPVPPAGKPKPPSAAPTKPEPPATKPEPPATSPPRTAAPEGWDEDEPDDVDELDEVEPGAVSEPTPPQPAPPQPEPPRAAPPPSPPASPQPAPEPTTPRPEDEEPTPAGPAAGAEPTPAKTEPAPAKTGPPAPSARPPAVAPPVAAPIAAPVGPEDEEEGQPPAAPAGPRTGEPTPPRTSPVPPPASPPPAAPSARKPPVRPEPAAPKPSPPRTVVRTQVPQPLVATPGPRVSEHVYPPQRYRIRMNHATHARELKLPCIECHRSVLGSDRVEDRNLPNHLSCQECHLSSPPGSTDCQQCHGDAERGAPVAALVPSPRLRFSHRSHIARLLDVAPEKMPQVKPAQPLGEQVYGDQFASHKIPPEIAAFKVASALCTNCHRNGNAATSDQRVQLPEMNAQCFNCHDDRKASRRCDLCHPEAPDAPLRAGGRGWRELGLYPRSHGQSWLQDHRDESRIRAASCTACHQRTDCLDCHAGRRYPSYHPASWLLGHGLQSRHATLRCQSCHAQQECQNCHRQRGVTDDTFPNKWQMVFHPIGWGTDKFSPRFHGIAGRRDLLSCTSCHREGDCQKPCHTH